MSSIPNSISLPSELLELIFDHALKILPVQDRSFQALAYSHVCRSYRQVALNSSRLWTSLSMRGTQGQVVKKLEFLEVCVERSKSSPLDVVLGIYKGDGRESNEEGEEEDQSDGASALGLHDIWVDNAFKWILLRSAQWRSCLLHFYGIRQYDRAEKYRPYSNFVKLFENIDAPLLEELRLETDFGMGNTSDLVLSRNNFPWKVPKLYQLTNDNTIPLIPFDFRSQLRSMDVNFHHEDGCISGHISADIRSLRCAMIAMTSLSTVQLSFIGCSFGVALGFPFVEMPSVEVVGITLLSCTQRFPRKQSLWEEFCNVHFPNATELNVTLDIGGGDELVLWNGYNTALYSLLAPSRAHERRYPSLETMRVNIHPWKPPPSLPSDHPIPVLPTLLLPYRFLSSLRNLEIRSLVSHWKLLDSVGEFDASQPPYFRGASEVTAFNLETAVLEISRVESVVPWMKQLALKMKDTGCWDRFSELTVAQPGASTVLSRDEVERWYETI
ncbi:hypothetical protein SCHPADRAFT_239280 [Schizopora paradoxa]|uniref:F-box domain-containing protein n=1 Tax=Schizopora paradoxa TaxID=27342 RepID=A0A0H2SFJ9_9AGAM|nr:hypothetical protein SCHPADRAFT_239280 [Schizopora paradoxa]